MIINLIFFNNKPNFYHFIQSRKHLLSKQYCQNLPMEAIPSLALTQIAQSALDVVLYSSLTAF